MTIRRRHLTLRGMIPWVGLTLALLVAPAHAFFPPVPVHIPPPKPPIHVPPPPKGPPVVTPPSVTPPGGGNGGGSGGTTQPPDTNPEPASLVLALLGGAGVGLFVACRRPRGQKRLEEASACSQL
jgi:hypothetical protein